MKATGLKYINEKQNTIKKLVLSSKLSSFLISVCKGDVKKETVSTKCSAFKVTNNISLYVNFFPNHINNKRLEIRFGQYTLSLGKYPR